MCFNVLGPCSPVLPATHRHGGFGAGLSTLQQFDGQLTPVAPELTVTPQLKQPQRRCPPMKETWRDLAFFPSTVIVPLAPLCQSGGLLVATVPSEHHEVLGVEPLFPKFPVADVVRHCGAQIAHLIM